MSEQHPIRIIIADDNDFMRMGLAVFISTYPDMILVGEAEDGAGVVQVTTMTPFDVLVIEMNLPSPNGIDMIHQIKQDHPRAWIVLLTGEHDSKRVQAAMVAGADIYLSKGLPSEQFISAIRSANPGISAS